MAQTHRFTATLTRDTDQGGYVAQANEVDVAAQGEAPDTALRNLRQALELHCATQTPAGDDPPTVLITSVDIPRWA